ncbi:MAG: tRNA 2'-phosphotransferase [Hyphomicrobiales bacterium]
MDLDKKLKKVSINLSKILRHQATKRNIHIDDSGWIKLNDILKCNEFKNTSLDDIKYIVDNNEKKRFTLELRNETYFIRANQGHTINSVKDELLLIEIKPGYINNVVHSTFRKNYDLIKLNGLCRMSRNHIHFAKSKDVSSGIRKNAEVYIYIDVNKAMDAGIKFYESSNGVILSPGIGEDGFISTEYFSKVEFRK